MSSLDFREEIARRRIELRRSGLTRSAEWEGDDPGTVFLELVRECARDAALALDIECGEGCIGRELARAAGLAIGVDPSKAAVEEATRSTGLSNLHIVRAAAFDLPFRDNLFDLACSRDGLDTLAMEALSEIRRVLTPGAVFVAHVSGESHRLETQQVFGRGVSWPAVRPVRFSIPEKLAEAGLETIFFSEHYASCYYPDTDSFAQHLAASAVIPDFEAQKDAALLREVRRKLSTDHGLRDIEHVAVFIARKPQ